jgi:uncharacterized cupin superfamily protein
VGDGDGQTRRDGGLRLHPLAPRALGSPVHTHRNDDEWSFVLEVDPASILRLAQAHALRLEG